MSDYCRLPPYRVEFRASPLKAEGIDWGVAAYGVPEVWKRTQGDGVTVAVIDSGISKHPALEDAVVDWRNFSSDSEFQDTLGHGTGVASIIAARTGLAKGIAPAAKLRSLKVLGHSGTGSNESVAAAVLHAAEVQCDIACMSLGTSRPDSRLHSAIQLAAREGVIVVCAAGNDGGAVNYPAAFAETIGVGAVDRSGAICEFSSRGKEIVVAAPGSEITTGWLGNGYATVSGTSFAAPFVAGTLALYVSAAKHAGRKITHADVLQALSQTCKDVGDTGRDSVYGWGLIDPGRLMNYTAQQVAGGVTIFIPGAKIL